MQDIKKALLDSQRLIETSYKSLEVVAKLLRQSQKCIQQSCAAILNSKTQNNKCHCSNVLGIINFISLNHYEVLYAA